MNPSTGGAKPSHREKITLCEFEGVAKLIVYMNVIINKCYLW